MFIAMLIALVGVVIYFFINFVSIFQIKKEKQYGLTNNYLTSFLSYKIFK
jgi:uncharacterized integral membrane protein